MGFQTKIQWTDHTFSPWWGCSRVSDACKHCYAADLARRFKLPIWGGEESSRKMQSDRYWRDPIAWNRRAAKIGRRERVFCASMSDVFEDRRDLDASRERLWKLIEETPALNWLLLTKRPQHAKAMAPWKGPWPRNIWLGTTTENQACVNERIPFLLENDVAVRFISCEPLLEAIDLGPWLGRDRVTWAIVGGESGKGARPMPNDWARSVRDQCQKAGVAYFYKQTGDWFEDDLAYPRFLGRTERTDAAGRRFVRVRKDEAGRLLDGREWSEVPSATR